MPFKKFYSARLWLGGCGGRWIMDNSSNNIKTYIYKSKKMINDLYQQRKQSNILQSIKFKLGLNFKCISASIENTNNELNDNDHIKITSIINHLKENGKLLDPGDHFMHDNYYCIETRNFMKVSLENSKIKTKYNIKKINFYIATDRKFTENGNISPLFLLPDKIDDIDGMDGSSGYKIFTLLFNDYLKCENSYLECINKKLKDDFAKDPISVFKELGCHVSDIRNFEVLYQKRTNLKDDLHNIVYTFAYPLYIATIA